MDSKLNSRGAAYWQTARARTIRTAVIAGLLMLCLTLLAWGQERTIMGKVTSADDGAPLPGVNVVIKGTNTGTITDNEGRYRIELSNGASLVFSFVGFTSQEITPGERTTVDVSLAQDARQLSEVVVTGTGVPTEKRKLAFAVESVSAKDLPSVPAASIDQALVGRIPGAQISSINGTPGAEMSILLRGINTINRGTMPMILVDGVQMGATLISSIDPTTIEKVEVIQGAAAATIYGAQGANGVIQIFTKKGSSGKVHIDFSSSISNNEFLNVGGMRKAMYHGFKTDASGQVLASTGGPLVQNPATLLYNGDVSIDLLDPNTKIDKPYATKGHRVAWPNQLMYYDHFKMFFQPTNIYTNSLSLSGGSEGMDFAISASNTHHQSNFRGDGYSDRSNLILNLGAKLAKGLSLRSITQLIYTKNTVNIWQKPDFGLSGNSGPLWNARPFADFEKLDLQGNHGAYYGAAASVRQFNPYYEYQYASTLDKKVDILQNLSLTYSPVKILNLELLYGLNWQDRNVRHDVQNQSLNANSNAGSVWTGWSNGVDNTGEVTVYDRDRTFQNLKATATLDVDFESDLRWRIPIRSSTQVAYDYRSDRTKNYRYQAIGMPLIPPQTASRGSTFRIPEDYAEDFVTYGYLLNQRLEFRDLAGVSGGFRTDYSSAFGKGSEPFTFPRADAFLRISSLPFWDKSGLGKSILEFKLRAAYGEAGIQPGPFDRYVTYVPRTLGTNNALYLGIDQKNENLGVEVSKEFEAGTDMQIDGFEGAWLNHFYLSVSYWKRRTDDIIYYVDVPLSSGFGRYLDNALSLESEGLQASLTVPILRSRSLNWNLTANYSTQATIVADVNVEGGQIITPPAAGGAQFHTILKEGEKIGQLYGGLMLNSVDQRKPDGTFFIPVDGEIDPSTGNEYTNNQVQSAFEVASNGWVVNKQSKQPFISAEKYSLGDPNPNFLMSFIQDITYSNFLTASVQVDWLGGARLYNNSRQWLYRDAVHSDYETPLTIDGQRGAWSAFYQGAYIFNPHWEKNYFYEDGSFVRLRNVSVGIDFDPLFRIKGLTKLQLVVSGRNLLTWTKYSGLDPEISTYGAYTANWGTSTLARGIDNQSLPNFRTYQVTLNIGL